MLYLENFNELNLLVVEDWWAKKKIQFNVKKKPLVTAKSELFQKQTCRNTIGWCQK